VDLSDKMNGVNKIKQNCNPRFSMGKLAKGKNSWKEKVLIKA
jgi:hypothetical protein